jgi:hypothetical protein
MGLSLRIMSTLAPKDNELIDSFAIDADGKTIATAGRTKGDNQSRIRIWNIATGKPLAAISLGLDIIDHMVLNCFQLAQTIARYATRVLPQAVQC